MKEAVVVVSAFAEEVERALGDGSRWGLRLEFDLSTGDESPESLAARVGGRFTGPLLAVRGDVLRSPLVAAFLARAAERPARAPSSRRWEGSRAASASYATPPRGRPPCRRSRSRRDGPAGGAVEIDGAVLAARRLPRRPPPRQRRRGVGAVPGSPRSGPGGGGRARLGAALPRPAPGRLAGARLRRGPLLRRRRGRAPRPGRSLGRRRRRPPRHPLEHRRPPALLRRRARRADERARGERPAHPRGHGCGDPRDRRVPPRGPPGGARLDGGRRRAVAARGAGPLRPFAALLAGRAPRLARGPPVGALPPGDARREPAREGRRGRDGPSAFHDVRVRDGGPRPPAPAAPPRGCGGASRPRRGLAAPARRGGGARRALGRRAAGGAGRAPGARPAPARPGGAARGAAPRRRVPRREPQGGTPGPGPRPALRAFFGRTGWAVPAATPTESAT